MFGASPPPQNEETKFLPQSPYGISKVAAFYMTSYYRRVFNLFASNGILFNHESPRRGLNFVTRKITFNLARILKKEIKNIELGNIEARRDWGFAGDYVEAMWLMLQHEKGDDYVVATNETYTVRDFLNTVFDYAGLGDFNKYVVIDPRLFRPNEVPFLKGNPAKAKSVLQWSPKHDMHSLAKMMYESDYNLTKNGKNYE